MTPFSDRLSAGLAQMGENPLEGGHVEFCKCLEMLTACHFYGKSPTVLCDPQQSIFFGPPRLLTLPRFEQCLKALSLRGPAEESGHNDTWAPCSDRIQPLLGSMNLLTRQTQAIGYHRHETLICLDDDKIHNRSVNSSSLGIQRTFQRGHSAGPVLIAAVSKYTGLLLAADLLLQGDTSAEVAKVKVTGCKILTISVIVTSHLLIFSSSHLLIFSSLNLIESAGNGRFS
jgi:hypothetical protein